MLRCLAGEDDSLSEIETDFDMARAGKTVKNVSEKKAKSNSVSVKKSAKTSERKKIEVSAAKYSKNGPTGQNSGIAVGVGSGVI